MKVTLKSQALDFPCTGEWREVRGTETRWNRREWKAVRDSWARGKAEGSELPGMSRWESWCSPVRLIPTCWQWMRGEPTASSASLGNLPAWGWSAVVFNGRNLEAGVLRPCVLCLLRRDGLSKCGKCKQAYYCNVDCQVGIQDAFLYTLAPTNAKIVCIQFLETKLKLVSFPQLFSRVCCSTLNECRYRVAPLGGTCVVFFKIFF